jgi:pimeloyl-ACP methyl ester carboxylesterase
MPVRQRSSDEVSVPARIFQGEILHLPGDGVKLAASAWGRADAMPICFFHGFSQSKRLWIEAAQIVARHGFLGLSVDLRGHGDSEWAPDGDYRAAAYGRDVACLIEHLARPVALVGGSRGGRAAFLGAAQRQDKVALVLLCDMAPHLQGRDRDRIVTYLQKSLAGFDSVEEAAELLYTELDQPRMVNVANLRKAMREEDGRLYWRWDRRAAADDLLHAEEDVTVMDEAAKVMKRPVVMLWGERESLVTPEEVERFRNMMPQLIVEQTKGTTHIFTWRDNALVANRVLHHLSRLAALGRARRGAVAGGGAAARP